MVVTDSILTNNCNMVSAFDATLVLTVFIIEAKYDKQTLFHVFVDSQEAFDIVLYSSILRKVYQSGVKDNLWIPTS